MRFNSFKRFDDTFSVYSIGEDGGGNALFIFQRSATGKVRSKNRLSQLSLQTLEPLELEDRVFGDIQSKDGTVLFPSPNSLTGNYYQIFNAEAVSDPFGQFLYYEYVLQPVK